MCGWHCGCVFICSVEHLTVLLVPQYHRCMIFIFAVMIICPPGCFNFICQTLQLKCSNLEQPLYVVFFAVGQWTNISTAVDQSEGFHLRGAHGALLIVDWMESGLVLQPLALSLTFRGCCMLLCFWKSSCFCRLSRPLLFYLDESWRYMWSSLVGTLWISYQHLDKQHTKCAKLDWKVKCSSINAYCTALVDIYLKLIDDYSAHKHMCLVRTGFVMTDCSYRKFFFFVCSPLTWVSLGFRDGGQLCLLVGEVTMTHYKATDASACSYSFETLMGFSTNSNVWTVLPDGLLACL